MVEYFKDCAGSPENERNDCTVRALSISTSQPYHDCYMLLASFGRKPNKGINIKNFFKNNKAILGHIFKKMPFRKPITLYKFVRQYPLGTFYVRIRGHVFVVKDGVAIDMMKPKTYCRITDAWSVASFEDCIDF
jgi:hypothetical protein